MSGSYIPPDKLVKASSGPFGTDRQKRIGGPLFADEVGGVEPVEDVILDRGGRPARAMTSAEMYPGLVGPMPQKFTPAETAATLASLKANQEPYLQVASPGGVTMESDGQFGGPGTSFSLTGATPTRAQSASERESIAKQLGFSDEREASLMADQDRELKLDQERQRVAFAADKAAREAAFTEEYGIPATDGAVTEVAKHNAKAALSEGLAQDLDAYDQMEAKELEGIGPGPAGGRLAIQKKYDNLRRLRMIAMGFSSGVSPGASLNDQRPTRAPGNDPIDPATGLPASVMKLMGGNRPTS